MPVLYSGKCHNMSIWQKIKKKLYKNTRKKPTEEFPDLKSYLTEIFGIRPGNMKYYERAFIHRSAQVKDDEGNDVNFERLEFLGDAVLGLIVAVFIFREAPNKQEGYLTKMRSKLVSRHQLNVLGKQLGLAKRLHPAGNPNLGEDINGNLIEALIGALYLDKGFDFTADFIFKNFIEKNINLEKLERSIASYKSLILEWAQKTKNKISFNTFEEEDSGEDLTLFISVVRLNEDVISKGRGTSKKRAEENAARRAYISLHREIENTIL